MPISPPVASLVSGPLGLLLSPRSNALVYVGHGSFEIWQTRCDDALPNSTYLKTNKHSQPYEPTSQTTKDRSAGSATCEQSQQPLELTSQTTKDRSARRATCRGTITRAGWPQNRSGAHGVPLQRTEHTQSNRTGLQTTNLWCWLRAIPFDYNSTGSL
jgi:hypothetical protein